MLVISKGDGAEVIDAAINTSHLWDQFKILCLTKKMRLQSSSDTNKQRKIRSFSEWLLQVGDGQIELPHDGITDIPILDELLLFAERNPVMPIVDLIPHTRV